jgi:hypothetical protein
MNNFFTLIKVFAILTIFLSPYYLTADEFDPDLLPSMLGTSNEGTLFYMTFHPTLEEGVVQGSGIRIYISSKYKATVTIEIAGIGVFKQRTTIPNDVIEFYLSPPEAQMYFKVYEFPRPEGNWQGRAIKISSDAPIVCYGLARFQATSDGYMALPVSSYGKEYQVASAPNAFGGWGGGYELSSFTSIVGAYSNTRVTFTLGGCANCYALKEDGSYLYSGKTITRTLNEGDVWLIPGIDANSDLTGSKIKADKPVAVFSGNQCAQIPTDIKSCDYIIEQELPIFTWGKTYLVSPIFGRKKYSIVKIFAAEPDTEVSINGVPTYTIKTAGGVKDTGFVEVRANTIVKGDESIKPVVISGNKPINVVQYNTGAFDDSTDASSTPNAPFQMQVLPVEQFSNNIMFNTPGINGQYVFKHNYVNIVYKATAEGQIPDSLMWAEVVNKKLAWVKLSSISDDPGMKFEYDESDGRYYYSKTIEIPNDGVYGIKADDPFAAYAYGFDFYDSYGFVYAGNFKDLTTDDELAPVVNYKFIDGKFTGSAIDVGGLLGKVKKDTDEIQAVTKASGLSVLTMISSLSENFKFVPTPFITGTVDSVKFAIEIINPINSAKAVIMASDRRGNDTVVVVNYTPLPMPKITGEKTTFDLVKSSQEAILEFKLENTLDVETEEIKSIMLENPDPKFTIIDNLTENTVLQVGERHTFKVKFRADDLNPNEINKIEGIFKNNLGFELTNGQKYFLQEIVATVKNPRIDMNNVNFKENPFDEEFKVEFITIKNQGENFLEIYDFEYSEDSHFIYSLPEASTENPFLINSKAEHKIKVEFKPDSPGTYFDTLKVTSDAYIIKEKSYLSAIALPTSVKENERIKSEIRIRYENNSFIFNSDTDYQLNSVEVYDLSGRLLHSSSSQVALNNYSMRLVGLSSGVYVVKMKINNSIINKKVII